MDRATHSMINDAGPSLMSSSTESSGGGWWSSLADSLQGHAGQALQLIGTGAKAYAAGSGYQAQGSRFQAQAEGFQRQAEWDETTLISTAIQDRVIGAQTLQEKIAAYDKWLWRRGSARARYASSGVAVDVGTPLAVTAELLSAQQEEISLINLNASIRRWNEVEMPTTQARAEAARSEHAADMAEVDAEGFRKAEKVSQLTGIINVAAQAADFFGGFA